MNYLSKEEIATLQNYIKFIVATVREKDVDDIDAEMRIKVNKALGKAVCILKEEPYLENVSQEEKKILLTIREFTNIPIEIAGESEPRTFSDIHPGDYDKAIELLNETFCVWGDQVIVRRNLWNVGIFERKLSEGLKKILKELWWCFCLNSDPSVIVMCHAALDVTLVDVYTSLAGLTEHKFNQLRNEENGHRERKGQKFLSGLMFSAHGLQKRGILSVEDVQVIDKIRKVRNSFVHDGDLKLKENQILEFVKTTIGVLEKLHLS